MFVLFQKAVLIKINGMKKVKETKDVLMYQALK